MLATYSYSTGCCLTSTSTTKSGDLADLIEDGESSDPLILCFSSTSVIVGRGGRASPMYAICCNASVVTDLLRPAMHQHKATPIVDLDSQDVSAPSSHTQTIFLTSTTLIPREIVSLARGESLVVTYPLAWSHVHDGDELELLSSFIFSTLGAATSLFVAAPLAVAYGLGIGLKEGDEGSARRLVQQRSSAHVSSAYPSNAAGDEGNSCAPPPPKSLTVGSKRQRDEKVVGCGDATNSPSSDCSSSSDDNESGESVDSSSEESASKNSERSPKNKQSKTAKSRTSKRVPGGRLLSVQIDATSMTVSHIATGSVQRFIKVSLGVKERATYTVDVSPILSSLETALSNINALISGSSTATSFPLLGVLHKSLNDIKQCIYELGRYRTSNTTVGSTPSLTDLVLASRDLTLSETTTTVQLETAVKDITRLCSLVVSGEDEEEERVGDVFTACSKLCVSARVSLHSLLLKREEKNSCVISDLFFKTGAVGNAIGKLEAKLDSDEEDSRRNPLTSLISLGGEVIEWLRIEASHQMQFCKGDTLPSAITTLLAIEESVCRTSGHDRRMVLLPTSVDTKRHTHNDTMIEFQGASLVAAIGDRDFLKLSMTAAEYSEKGPSHIRWRCAR